MNGGDAHPGVEASKADWRRWAKRLDPVPEAVARAVVDHLIAFLVDVEDPVLTYVALRDEVDIERVARPGALRSDLAAPRVGDDAALTVHLDDGAREHHRLGVEQPSAHAEQIEPAVLGAVLVPGRVFDRHGFRLGRGGGHYDRLVPRLDPQIAVIGVTCEARLVERLPREDHDVPMTHLATETGVFSVGAR